LYYCSLQNVITTGDAAACTALIAEGGAKAFTSGARYLITSRTLKSEPPKKKKKRHG
jgi:hypothetical protein